MERIPPPKDARNEPLRALIFDSYYDAYKVGDCWGLAMRHVPQLVCTQRTLGLHRQRCGRQDAGPPSLPPATHLMVCSPNPAPIVPAGRDCAVPRDGRRAAAWRPRQVHEHGVRAVCLPTLHAGHTLGVSRRAAWVGGAQAGAHNTMHVALTGVYSARALQAHHPCGLVTLPLPVVADASTTSPSWVCCRPRVWRCAAGKQFVPGGGNALLLPCLLSLCCPLQTSQRAGSGSRTCRCNLRLCAHQLCILAPHHPHQSCTVLPTLCSPLSFQVESLYAGEVGYLAASIKQVADARVGDTITLKKQPAAEALPGYTEAMPMVFCGLFPTGAWTVSCAVVNRAGSASLALRRCLFPIGAPIQPGAVTDHPAVPCPASCSSLTGLHALCESFQENNTARLPLSLRRRGPVPRAARRAAQAAAERRGAQV